MKHPAKIFKVVLAICSMASFSQSGYCQGTAVATPPTQNMLNVIESIKELSTKRDTVRVNERIVVKLKTQQPVASFNTLYIDGIKIDGLTYYKTNEYEKLVFFKLDSRVQDAIRKYMVNEASDNNIVPIQVSLGNDSDESFLAKNSELIYFKVKDKIENAWVWISAVSIAFVLLIFLALWHNILKDDKNVFYSLINQK